MTRVPGGRPSPLPARRSVLMRRLWIGTIAVATVAAVAVGFAPVSGALLFVFLVVGLIVTLSPGYSLWAIVVSALIVQGLQSYLGLPSQVLLLPKLLIAVFALSSLLQAARGRSIRARPTFLVVWIGVLALSTLFAASDRVLALQALWAYACGPVVFFAILYSDVSIAVLRRVSLAVIVIAGMELPIVLLQNEFIATHVDQIGGTFGLVGGTSVMAIVMGFAWTAAVAVLGARKRLRLIPMGLAIAVVLLVCEAKTGFLFCALGTVAVGLTRGVLTKRFATVSLQYIAMAVASVAALFGGYMYAGDLWKGGERAAAYALGDIGSYRAITSYLFSYGPHGQAGRLEGVRLALTLGRPAIADLLLGRGPGLLSSSALLGGASAFRLMTGNAYDWATSLTRSVLETGVLGTLLYLGVIVSAVRTVFDSWRPRGDDLGMSVFAGCVGLASIYVLSGVYAPGWHTDAVTVLFWCLIGMAAKWGHLRHEQEVAAT